MSEQLELKYVSIKRMTMLRRNPQYVKPETMEGLKRSILLDGFLCPILLSPRDDDRFEILSGNHRYMAAVELGLDEIPAIIVVLSDQARARVAVTLNTVHGEPPLETLAPFLAEMTEETLRTVYVNAATVRRLAEFDRTLENRLAQLRPPPSVDRGSTGNIPDCVCVSCGKRHQSVPASNRLKSNSDGHRSTAEQKNFSM